MESKSDQRKFELGISNEKVRLIISQNILLPDRGQEFSYITHCIFLGGGGVWGMGMHAVLGKKISFQFTFQSSQSFA